MKPSDSAVLAPIFAPGRKPSLSAVTSTPKRFAAIVGKRISDGVTQLQISRMELVLLSMTDEQLRKVGVDRSDVKRHAEYLVTYKYDGL